MLPAKVYKVTQAESILYFSEVLFFFHPNFLLPAIIIWLKYASVCLVHDA